MSLFFSVPDASRKMMWDQIPLLPLRIGRRLLLFLLDGVVEEEVDEDGVEGGFGVLTKDFAPEELDTPYAATCGRMRDGEGRGLRGQGEERGRGEMNYGRWG